LPVATLVTWVLLTCPLTQEISKLFGVLSVNQGNSFCVLLWLLIGAYNKS